MEMSKTKNQSLKLLSLGGWSGVNQNMFVYETDRDVLIVDCGVDFPDDPDSKVEVLVPDVSYLKSRRDKIRGVLITHGHMDHFGALPFILPQIGNPPVYATRLVKGFIEARMAEFDIGSTEIRLIDPSRGPFRLGSFGIDSFRVNHSVPDSVGFCLTTPVGKIFHVADFKFDLTPVDGRVFEIAKAAQLAHSGVLALLCDCLGAIHSGFTSSEQEIENIFDQIIRETKGQIFITTISSNISRFQQAIQASLEHGRRIVFLGRSVEEKIEVARQLDYLKLDRKNIVLPRKAKKMPQGKLTYLVAGSYGQSNSALSRIADDDYRDVKLEKGATVVFSADPAPPGSRQAVDRLVDKLTLRGAKVYYYEIQENLHVSGHGSANDIRLLFAIVKPKYFFPIGGNPRHIRAYYFLAREMGARGEQILELFNGEIVQLSSNQARIVDRIKIKSLPVMAK